MGNKSQKFGIVSDLLFVIKKEKKLWLIPLIIILFTIVGLMIFAGSAGPLSPFLYPLF